MTTTNSSTTSNVVLGQTLGRYTVWSPLSVLVTPPGLGSKYWIATLEPGELTCHEWGCGDTPEGAAEDLEEVVSEMREIFLERFEDDLCVEMAEYKKVLFSAVTVNSKAVSDA